RPSGGEINGPDPLAAPLHDLFCILVGGLALPFEARLSALAKPRRRDIANGRDPRAHASFAGCGSADRRGLLANALTISVGLIPLASSRRAPCLAAAGGMPASSRSALAVSGSAPRNQQRSRSAPPALRGRKASSRPGRSGPCPSTRCAP